MQLLIDDGDFNVPGKLRFLARFLLSAADSIESLPIVEPSINGPSEPIKLVPAERFIDAQPLTTTPTDPAAMDPAVVFGRASNVPAGTQLSFPAPAAPPAPPVVQTLPNATPDVHTSPSAALPVFVPPAPGMTLPNVSDVMTTGVTFLPSAPAAANLSTTQSTVAGATVSKPTEPFDSEGLPWDARIHSETHKLNADGTWRYRRNLDSTVKAAVYAELKAQAAAPLPPLAPSVPPVAPPAPTTPYEGNAAPPAPPVSLLPGTAPAVPLPPSVSVGVSNAPHAPVVPTNNFRELMTKINQALAFGRLTQEQVVSACKAVNLDSITALAAQPGLVGVVDAQINQILGAVVTYASNLTGP